MEQNYGIDRVVSPPQVFPAAAWELDNSRELRRGEIRVSLRRIHIEGTSFRQMCQSAGSDEDLLKEKIIDIVMARGKLHNPMTDTGGVLYGVIEEIDPDYENTAGFAVGDEVFCNASLAGVPMKITRVTHVDPVYPQIEAEGYAILLPGVPILKKPADLPVDLLLFIFNESGTIYNVSKEAAGKNCFAVIGNSQIMTLLYGYTIRRAAGAEAQIYCLLDRNTEPLFQGEKMQRLVEQVFTKVDHMNMLRPVTCLKKLEPYPQMDLSVNCVDIPGSETINVVATRSGGTVVFANFISNYNMALYITEAVSRDLKIMCADGYINEYADFDFELVRELAPFIEGGLVRRDQRRSRSRQSIYEKELHEIYRLQNLSVTKDLVVSSAKMNAVIEDAITVAKYDCNVLITGDTGVGKERIASLIQKNSTRKMYPYLKINCASIAPNLMESEFFGYEKGAFTGADARGKKGLFETADNGVIFLDEVGELPLDMQAKLLRVIQDGEFLRVGGTVPIKTNVRILSATNRRLEDMVEAKNFRRDLYYRLNVFPINIPPLSERRDDIPALIEYFIGQYNEKFGMNKYIDDDAVDYLSGLSWPGNIRELENVMQRLMISSKNDNITMMDVLKEMDESVIGSVQLPAAKQTLPEEGGVDLSQMMDAFEKELIRTAWEEHGSTRKAAKALGISQTQFVRKKNKYGLE
ncbi:MAG: sigma 54-interacting transcriptional regulator [Firmicutes bacterium]|nr:sigma 54-interacting transcriptional regulator [Bacillota bacterium]